MPRIVVPQVPQSRRTPTGVRGRRRTPFDTAHLPYSESRLKAPPSAYTPSETA